MWHGSSRVCYAAHKRWQQKRYCSASIINAQRIDTGMPHVSSPISVCSLKHKSSRPLGEGGTGVLFACVYYCSDCCFTSSVISIRAEHRVAFIAMHSKVS